jgi:SPP1 gp7 family putative phage head morphogenesis protein
MVAETETRTALNQAQNDLWREMQQAGKISNRAVRVFRTHKDERTCPICRPLNGRRSSIGDNTNTPPVHPNCRCKQVLVDLGVVTKAHLVDEHHFQIEIGDTTPMLDTGFRHNTVVLKAKKKTNNWGEWDAVHEGKLHVDHPFTEGHDADAQRTHLYRVHRVNALVDNHEHRGFEEDMNHLATLHTHLHAFPDDPNFQIPEGSIGTRIRKWATEEVSEVTKAPLTMQRRRGLKSSDFAIPEKAPGPGSYPIQSRHQAGIALALAAMHGEDLSRVQSAVYAKYPELKKDKKVSKSVDALDDGFRFRGLMHVVKVSMCDCCQKGGCDCKPGCDCCTPACFATFDTDAT